MDGATEPGHHDWGPFDRPLFDDPSARALSRVGVVDVGSNSVRLVVFDGAARSPAYFYNEKIMCGLGIGIAETGKLNPQGRARALTAITRFQMLAKGMGLAPLSAVATAAVREASDGPEFCAEVLEKTGLKLFVVDGQEEARLSAQGVLLGWPGANGLACDIGGASMELARLEEGRVGDCISTPLAPMQLRDLPGGRKARKARIQETLAELRQTFPEKPKRLFLVGGSWRAIARLDMLRRGYPLAVLHEYRMAPAEAAKTVDWILKTDPDLLRSMSGLSEARIALVPLASEVLKGLLSAFRPRELAVSAYGIREGLLYEQMPQRLRDRDPLIEACRFSEKKDARFPGFGKTLFDFLEPLYKTAPPERIRLIKAACLLHDVTWRAHPDYRAEVCFDNATRANLGGLNHPERIFLGLTLLHRYKNNRSGSRFETLINMLPEKDIIDAEVLGKAMRFGAMFSVSTQKHMGHMRYFPKKKKLEFVMRQRDVGLLGEVAEARLASLGASLGAETSIVIEN